MSNKSSAKKIYISELNMKFFVISILLSFAVAQDDFLYGTFPNGFEWGTATSAYQIEGAWNESGKGENIWDFMAHSDPNGIANGDTGDTSCDSYHNYLEDVNCVKELGLDYYRFSLSWSRILPTGRNDVINQDGIDYYNNLINALLQNGIKPLITLYHWDLPQPLQEEFGGWLGEEIVDIFGDYATVVFSSFGDRVKNWITLNEPWVQSTMGYGSGINAPRIVGRGKEEYIAAHNLLKSHARAWHIYDDNFRATQGGEIGLTLNSAYCEPATLDPADIEAAEIGQQFELGWFAHPVYSAEGDYPSVMKEHIVRHSAEEGLSESRLPEFDAAWIAYIKGTSDFFGLNFYTAALVSPGEAGQIPSWDHDQDIIRVIDPEWPTSSTDWLYVVPWSFRKMLNWIKNEYNNPRVIVTENGYADFGGTDDQLRIDFYNSYINEMMKAVNLDGCNVTGYTAWSIIDNLEWSLGFVPKFGLYDVDFNDPARPRTAKRSAANYKQIVADNGFPEVKK